VRHNSLGRLQDYGYTPGNCTVKIGRRGGGVYALSLEDGVLAVSDTLDKVMAAALDYAANGKICLDPGEYPVKQAIEIPAFSRVMIVGAGVHNTIIKYTGEDHSSFSTDYAVFKYESDKLVQDSPFNLASNYTVEYSQHLHIADLTIDTQAARFMNGLVAVNIDRLFLVNVRFKGYYSSGGSDSNYPSSLVTGFAVYIDTMANNEVHLENVKISGYYGAVRIRGDHSYLENVKVGKAYIAFTLSSGTHYTFIHPESYLVSQYHYYFNSSAGRKTVIVNPSIEGSGNSVAFQVNSWADRPVVLNPYISGVAGITNDPGKLILRGNGFEASGEYTASGDGSTTSFTIPHGLLVKPGSVAVTACSADAAGDYYVSWDADNIYVDYKTAPPSGTDNIKLCWRAQA